MAKRATKKKSQRPAPLTASRVRAGWQGPADTRIRLAQAQDTDAADALMAQAGVRLIPALRSAVEDGTAADALLAGLEGTKKTFHRAVALQLAGGDWPRAMSSISLTLVAVDGQDQPVGALSVTAPANVIEQAINSGHSQAQALLVGLTIAKVHGLAVNENARGQGVAAALLKRAGQVYDKLGYHLLYGSYEIERDLGNFYSRCGYTVLAPGEGIPLSRIALPIGIKVGPGECAVARWLRR